MSGYIVTLNHGVTTHRLGVQARSHEEAYRQALMLLGAGGRAA